MSYMFWNFCDNGSLFPSPTKIKSEKTYDNFRRNDRPPHIQTIAATIPTYYADQSRALSLPRIITSEREARSEFLLIYTKNLSMSGRPAGRGHAFERLISLEP